MKVESEEKVYDDINITPMLDVAYVLLLIFIIMTTAGVQGVKVDLPRGSKAPALGGPKSKAITVNNEGKVLLDTVPVTLAELEAKLSTAEIIDVAQLTPGDKVVFGATVDLEAEDDGKRVTYTIVGDDEADIRASRIAITSPIARALIGKSEGDVVDVTAPGGVRSYEIVAVRYEG